MRTQPPGGMQDGHGADGAALLTSQCYGRCRRGGSAEQYERRLGAEDFLVSGNVFQ